MEGFLCHGSVWKKYQKKTFEECCIKNWFISIVHSPWSWGATISIFPLSCVPCLGWSCCGRKVKCTCSSDGPGPNFFYLGQVRLDQPAHGLQNLAKKSHYVYFFVIRATKIWSGWVKAGSKVRSLLRSGRVRSW